MEPEQLGKRLPHLRAGDHCIYKTVLFLILCPLEALRQSFADGLLNDPGTGKADECAGLSENDVSQRGEAGGDAAGGCYLIPLR